MKTVFRLLLPLTLILVLMSSCSPGNTSTPAQLPVTAVPIGAKIPSAAATVGFVDTAVTPNSPSEPTVPPTAASGLNLSSPAFANNGQIPQIYTCTASSISPQLQFGNVPTGSQSLALTLEDPDAPRGVFVHWVIYNMPPSLAGLNQDVPKHADVSGVGTQGLNGAGLAGYTGPCPPTGSAHHYIFTLYALDLKPTLPEGLTADTLKAAIQGHILAQAQWVGLYHK
ncbi:MAG: YbhB/YbcL family Raf kinase inhibitor-like protein [Anaerolineaceae bacterium]|nr:YbhB/YbcL family Raf kinase inhibitor-like protein [Anaerolineaceae bacterium]